MSAGEHQGDAGSARAGRGRLIFVAALVIAAATFAIDVTTPRGFAAGIVPYLFAISITGWIEDRRAPLALAGVATLASFAGFALTRGGDPAIILINRLVLVAAFWLAAWIVVLKQRAAAGLREVNAALEDEVASRTASLRQRTEELEDEVAARRGAQAALAESEERLRIITDRLPALVAYIDGDLRYRFMNPRYAARAGTLPEAAHGRLVREVVGEKVFSVLSPFLARALAGEDASGETEVPFASGTRTMRYAYVPHRNAAGAVVGAVGLLDDVTEERRRANELHQAQKMQAVGHLAGGIAHDFNNLLAVIMGNIELAQLDVKDEDPLVPTLAAALRATESGAELAHRLLAFSSTEPRDDAVVDTGRALTGMLETLRSIVGGTIAIETGFAADLWPITADPALFENVVVNLALNARDAMPEGGTLAIRGRNVQPGEAVSVDVAPGVSYVALSFADTGTGMTAEVVERAFEPFFSTRGAGRGAGLGLYIVYSFAVNAGGRVTLDSAPGRGTTVTLWLPAVPGEARPQPGAAAPSAVEDAPQGAGETVLVVEDNAELRGLVAGMLESLGYRVVVAADAAAGLAALERMAGSPPALLLSDVILTGGINGFTLADRARERHPGLRAAFMSGYTAETARSGADRPLLRKPFRKIDLARFVRDALEAPPPSV